MARPISVPSLASEAPPVLLLSTIAHSSLLGPDRQQWVTLTPPQSPSTDIPGWLSLTVSTCRVNPWGRMQEAHTEQLRPFPQTCHFSCWFRRGLPSGCFLKPKPLSSPFPPCSHLCLPRPVSAWGNPSRGSAHVEALCRWVESQFISVC